MTKPNFTLYYAAQAADDAFSMALQAAYGRKRAGDMRYRQAHPGHPGIEAAAAAFQEASDAWLKEMRRLRES